MQLPVQGLHLYEMQTSDTEDCGFSLRCALEAYTAQQRDCEMLHSRRPGAPAPLQNVSSLHRSLWPSMRWS